MVTKNGNGKNHKGGKAPCPIDWELVGLLSEIQCTELEIVHVLKKSRRTLQMRCLSEKKCHLSEFMERHREGGKASLRRLMWEKARGREGELLTDSEGKLVTDDKGRPQFKVLPINPDTTMQIWLSKNVLAYADKVEHTGESGEAIKVEVDVKSKIISSISRLSTGAGQESVNK